MDRVTLLHCGGCSIIGTNSSSALIVLERYKTLSKLNCVSFVIKEKLEVRVILCGTKIVDCRHIALPSHAKISVCSMSCAGNATSSETFQKN